MARQICAGMARQNKWMNKLIFFHEETLGIEIELNSSAVHPFKKTVCCIGIHNLSYVVRSQGGSMS